MKLVKSLLLGTVAGVAAVAGAQAADLPARKAAPVEYVRVCTTYGAGFFYIPGTDSCLKIGGRVRGEIIYTEPFTRADDALIVQARGRMQLDHRTATAYGLLRTFIRYDFTHNGLTGNSPGLTQAFVQFGGLTAGRAVSFFANSDLGSNNWFSTLRFYDGPENNVFAYTFTLGGGFSATIAVEDGRATRTTGFTTAVLTDATITGEPVAIVPGGQTMPDIVGNLKYAGTWGNLQLSGAVHQLRDVGVAPTAATTTVGVVGGQPAVITTAATPGRVFADTEYGFAVSLSGTLNLPMLAAGDVAWFNATYANGAPAYAGFGSTIGFGGQATLGVVDGTINPVTNDIDKTEVWAIAGGFTHYWVPTLRSGIFGSYAEVETGGFSTVTTAGALVGASDFSEWRIGANTIWTPVSGLDIGVEVLYAEADFENGRRSVLVPSALAPGGGVGVLRSDVGAVQGILRVQRSF